MPKLTIVIALLLCVSSGLIAQITFRGCTGVLGNQDYTFNSTGTTNNGGTIRNIYETTPSDFAQSCNAGTCELRTIWNAGQSRWEIQLDNDGPASTPDYTTAVLYFNTTASYPNPPDLSLGTWVNFGFCPDPITTLSGDVQSTATLPVELVSFTVKQVNHEALLNWQTASEQNNDRFEVEYSGDGVTFRKIGEVRGQGTSEAAHNYAFTTAAHLGINYYRLKQVDYDGQYSHSRVQSLRMNHNAPKTSELYPNPSASGIVDFDHYATADGVLPIHIFNLAGQQVHALELPVSAGNNHLSLALTSLDTGVYHVRIGNGDGASHHKLILH